MSELESFTRHTVKSGRVVVVTGASENRHRMRAYLSEALPHCWLNASDLQVAQPLPDV